MGYLKNFGQEILSKIMIYLFRFGSKKIWVKKNFGQKDLDPIYFWSTKKQVGLTQGVCQRKKKIPTLQEIKPKKFCQLYISDDLSIHHHQVLLLRNTSVIIPKVHPVFSSAKKSL